MVGSRDLAAPGRRSIGCSRWMLFVMSCVLALRVAMPAVATGADWVVRSFDARLVVQPNGDVLVTEDIAVDFGSLQRHGIYRDIPVHYGFRATRERRMRVEDAHVQAGPGTPDDLVVSRDGNVVRLRIGSPSQLVSGPHRYRITYRVVGAMSSFATHEELYWSVTGFRWEVPIERVSALVTGPQSLTRVACYAGPGGGTKRCAEATLDDGTVRYSTGPLNPGDDMSVFATFSPGSVRVPPPELEPVSDGTAPASDQDDYGLWENLRALLLLMLMVAGVVWFILREQRKEEAALSEQPEEEPPEVAPLPPPPDLLIHDTALPEQLEERPPEGLRPAMLSLLLDQKVEDRAIAATLVDLAVRGFLSIEVVAVRKGKVSDWRLIKRAEREAPGLLPLADYERALYEALFPPDSGVPFREGDSVLLSKLGGRLARRYETVREQLCRTPEVRDWFQFEPGTMPRSSRIRMSLLLGLSLLLSCGSCVTAQPYLLIPLPLLVIVTLVLNHLAKLPPPLTPAGVAMRQRAQGFREFIRTAPHQRMRLVGQQHLFSELLPYAMAFGLEAWWVHAFPELPAREGTYALRGRWLLGARVLHASSLSELSSSLTSFSPSIHAVLASRSRSTSFIGYGTTASTGGSGFSEGGGSSGGGGG
ncbi:DUF2207 domain-containing protein, partial [Pyxidicoccus fallax]|nr:DUF2207 domain-containing protein [Pyxidicoccus fallax]